VTWLADPVGTIHIWKIWCGFLLTHDPGVRDARAASLISQMVNDKKTAQRHRAELGPDEQRRLIGPRSRVVAGSSSERLVLPHQPASFIAIMLRWHDEAGGRRAQRRRVATELNCRSRRATTWNTRPIRLFLELVA